MFLKFPQILAHSLVFHPKCNNFHVLINSNGTTYYILKYTIDNIFWLGPFRPDCNQTLIRLQWWGDSRQNLLKQGITMAFPVKSEKIQLLSYFNDMGFSVLDVLVDEMVVGHSFVNLADSFSLNSSSSTFPIYASPANNKPFVRISKIPSNLHTLGELTISLDLLPPFLDEDEIPRTGFHSSFYNKKNNIDDILERARRLYNSMECALKDVPVSLPREKIKKMPELLMEALDDDLSASDFSDLIEDPVEEKDNYPKDKIDLVEYQGVDPEDIALIVELAK